VSVRTVNKLVLLPHAPPVYTAEHYKQPGSNRTTERSPLRDNLPTIKVIEHAQQTRHSKQQQRQRVYVHWQACSVLLVSLALLEAREKDGEVGVTGHRRGCESMTQIGSHCHTHTESSARTRNEWIAPGQPVRAMCTRCNASSRRTLGMELRGNGSCTLIATLSVRWSLKKALNMPSLVVTNAGPGAIADAFAALGRDMEQSRQVNCTLT
jgi:hypothetical protein